MKLTRDDRKFLRTIRIDPEPTPAQVMQDVLSELPEGRGPALFLISPTSAKAIVEEYGELTLETWARWRLQHP